MSDSDRTQPSLALNQGSSAANLRLTSSDAARPGRAYVVISPCRDEAKYARETLDSVIKQTERPALWIIVDDGSTDQTAEILAEYATKYPWIKIIHRADRGERVLGSGVMEAFYSGLDAVNPADYNFLCKLDLDLRLPPLYFSSLMDKMEADPRLGACSGKPYFVQDQDGRAISEKCGDEHAVGMTKFYRASCFQQIGGFVKELMWDGIDTHRCRMLGWKAASWDDNNLRFIHLRPMGTSHKNWITGRIRHGRGQYFMGTSAIYMLASAFYRIFHPPIVVGCFAMLYGYFKEMFTQGKRYDDPAFRRFLRSYQRTCLFKGKARATRALEGLQAAVWRQPSK